MRRVMIAVAATLLGWVIGHGSGHAYFWAHPAGNFSAYYYSDPGGIGPPRSHRGHRNVLSEPPPYSGSCGAGRSWDGNRCVDIGGRKQP